MKRFWIVFPVLLIAGLVMMGCPDGGGGGGKGDITWTLSANGAGENNTGTETTTQITINFNKEPEGLLPNNISIAGGPATISGGITGTGKTRVVPVTVTDSGSVSLTINKAGIAAGPKSVTVWKEGAEKLNGYTAAANGASDTTTSTQITFTFDEAVTGLLASDITITAGVGATGGDVAKDTLSGSGTTWTLKILTEKQGIVVVKITKAGIYAGNTNVNVYMKVEAGPPAIPADGATASLKWHKLEVDPSDDDPEVEAENESMGKGVITGEDFDAIVAATAFKETHLRIYLDETAVPSGHSGWGIGALGNIENAQGIKDGQINLGFSAASPGGYAYVDIPLKNLKDYYSEDDGEIYVNIWDGAKIRAILLYEPIPAVLEEVLPEGVSELAIPADPANPGKGFLGSADMTKINNAKPGSYIELYVSGSPQATYGFCELIYNNSWTSKETFEVPDDVVTGGDFVYTVTVADIKYFCGVLDYDETNKHANGTLATIGFNIWGSTIFTKIWLVEIDDGEDPPPPEPPEPPDYEVVGNLGDFSKVNSASQKGWETNENLDWATIKAAKYIVIKAVSTNRYGIGGIQFIVQGGAGDADNPAEQSWAQIDLKGWTPSNAEEDKGNEGYGSAADQSFYFVIDLSTCTNWVTFVSGTNARSWGQIFIGGVDGINPLLGAWILNATEGAALDTKPASALGWDGPTDFTHGYIVRSDNWTFTLAGDE